LELRICLDRGPACDTEVVREGPSGRQPLSSCESLLADGDPQRGLERGAPWPTLSEDEFQGCRQVVREYNRELGWITGHETWRVRVDILDSNPPRPSGLDSSATPPP
jgi:hypothetical protein